MRTGIRAAGLALAVLAVPAGAHASTAEVDALGAAHAAEHDELARIAAERTRRWRALSPTVRRRARARERAQQRALVAQSGPSDQVGSWEVAPFAIPNFAIHAVLMPTGKVLSWGYPPKVAFNIRPNFGQASVWDPGAGTGSDAFKDVPPPLITGSAEPTSIYCSGQNLLADGTVLLTGGNKRFPSGSQGYAGLDKVFTFNPWNETWTQQPDMRHGRWYPSQVELEDGRTLIVGGYDESEPGGRDTTDVEVFTPAAELDGQGSIELKQSASRQTALYPHLFLMPDGDVLLGGPGQGDSGILDTDSFTWRNLPQAKEDRIGGTAVLHLGGTDGPTRVTQIGGYAYVDAEADSPAHTSSETLSYSDPDAGWSPDAPLNIGRSYANTVLLPDGSMVTVGGGKGKYPRQDDNFTAWEDGRARQIELWDPDSNSWTLGPPQQEDRGYHSTALLLPDGRVLSGGDDLHPVEDSDTAEIYSPPYMFKGTRPEVTSVPAAMPWGKQFAVHTSADVGAVVLMAPGATTHGADMHQRRIPLSITKRLSGQGVNALTPGGPATAPPGWYMLFVVDSNGVPSTASWIRLGADAPAPPFFDTDPPRAQVALLRTSLKRLARLGRLTLRLSADEPVSGRMDARMRVQPKDGRAFSTPLGYTAGKLLLEGRLSRKFRFKLSRAQRKEMRRAKNVDVIAKAKLTDDAMNRATTSLRKRVR